MNYTMLFYLAADEKEGVPVSVLHDKLAARAKNSTSIDPENHSRAAAIRHHEPSTADGMRPPPNGQGSLRRQAIHLAHYCHHLRSRALLTDRSCDYCFLLREREKNFRG